MKATDWLSRAFNVFVILSFSLATPLVLSDSRQVIQYQYDESGNIINIDSEISLNSPSVTISDLGTIRRGQSRHLTVSGADLSNAAVSPDDSGLFVSAVSSSSVQVQFDLRAADITQLGIHQIAFSTSLGEVLGQIRVLPRPPVLDVTPNPIVLSSNGQVTVLRLALQSPDSIDHQMTLAVSDPSVVQLSITDATILAGLLEPNAAISLSAQSAGRASFTISSQTLGDHHFTVSVTPDFQLQIGDSFSVYETSLGILKEGQTGQLDLRGPIYSELGLFKGDPLVTDPDLISGLVSQQLTLLKGNAIVSVTPSSVTAGQGPLSISVEGIGLADVDAVAIEPPDGLTLGSVIAAADGTSVTFPLTVDADLDLSLRKIILSVSGSDVEPLFASSNRLYVGGAIPLITYLKPITVPRQSVISLDIVGENFDQVSAVTVEPVEGITLSVSPSDTDPQFISVQMEVDQFSTLGQRVVRVHSVTGSSSDIASAANSLWITNGPGELLTPLAALSLGINKSDGDAPEIRNLEVHSNAKLSIVKGSVLSGITPQAAAVGESLSLTLNGSNLSSLDSILFQPSDGIVVSNIVAAGDGLSAKADIAIDADAETTLRQITVSAASQSIPAATPESDRFRVTPPQPQITYIAPIFLVAGDPPIDVTIYGQLLSETSAVSVIPAEGITINTPVPDASGQRVTVQISAAADAPLTPRVITVQTPGGSSTMIADATNSIDIISGIQGIVTPLISASLGINKQTTNTGTEQDYFVTSVALGLEKTITLEPATKPVDISSPILRVAKGPIADSISPPVVQTSTNVNLLIDGVELDTVNSLSFVPSEGISTIGTPTINPEGTQLTQLISITSDAAKTLRQVVLTGADKAIEFSQPASARILIAGELPVIESVSPIQQVQGSSFELLIRGQDLDTVIAVSASPNDGLIFGSRSVNPEGTELRVQVGIDSLASLGVRAIVLTAAAGDTSSTATSANSLTIVD